MNAINCLNGSCSPSWNIDNFIMKTIDIIKSMKKNHIIHAYHESNVVENSITNVEVRCDQRTSYHELIMTLLMVRKKLLLIGMDVLRGDGLLIMRYRKERNDNICDYLFILLSTFLSVFESHSFSFWSVYACYYDFLSL